MIQRFLLLILLVFLTLFAEFVIRDRFSSWHRGVERPVSPKPETPASKDETIQARKLFPTSETTLNPPPLLPEHTRSDFNAEVHRSPAPGISSDVVARRPLQPLVSPRTKLDAAVLHQVRIQEIGPGRYEANATDVQAVLDNADRVLADLWPKVQPGLTFETGLQYQITSAAGDGVLSGHGFIVTDPKLAQKVGIQAGDVILSVNGHPVDGLASAYRIYHMVRRDGALRTVQVKIERRGMQLTQTYRVR